MDYRNALILDRFNEQPLADSATAICPYQKHIPTWMPYVQPKYPLQQVDALTVFQNHAN